ncbi:UNVERIFIED_CONTAM: hypothetical protein BEN50_17925 [Euhalothece sp. KZN 001]
MAINQKTFMEEGLKARIDNYYAPQTIAFLINDSGGVLTPSSDMAAVAGLELPAGNGYTRQAVTLPSASIVSGSAESTSDQIIFQASGGNIPQFSHICFCVGGSTTVGSTTGKIDRIEPVNNGTPLSLNDGESYIHQFTQTESGNYVTS